ncbi:hypothetical protein BB429_07130 [Helicobacter pylori]|nr:hypothetical protein BB429_07130 [Helicobacter pylori]
MIEPFNPHFKNNLKSLSNDQIVGINPQERFNGEKQSNAKRRLEFLWFKTLFCSSKFYGKTHFLRG